MALLGALCIGLNALGFTHRSLRAQVNRLLGAAYTLNQASYDFARLRLTRTSPPTGNASQSSTPRSTTGSCGHSWLRTPRHPPSSEPHSPLSTVTCVSTLATRAWETRPENSSSLSRLQQPKVSSTHRPRCSRSPPSVNARRLHYLFIASWRRCQRGSCSHSRLPRRRTPVLTRRIPRVRSLRSQRDVPRLRGFQRSSRLSRSVTSALTMTATTTRITMPANTPAV